MSPVKGFPDRSNPIILGQLGRTKSESENSLRKSPSLPHPNRREKEPIIGRSSSDPTPQKSSGGDGPKDSAYFHVNKSTDADILQNASPSDQHTKKVSLGQMFIGPKKLDPFERGERKHTNKPVDFKLILTHPFVQDKHLLFNLTRARINPSKIWDYALSSDHSVGKKKSKLFEALGFRLGSQKTHSHVPPSVSNIFHQDGLFLVSQIRNNLTRYPSTYEGRDKLGLVERFKVDMIIQGVNGRISWVTTSWAFDLVLPDRKLVLPSPRLTSIIPHGKKETERFIKQRFPDVEIIHDEKEKKKP